MGRNRIPWSVRVLAAWIIGAAAALAAAATADAPRITKEEAKALLGAPKVVFVDDRISKAWNKSSQKIPGAVRPDKWDTESWVVPFDQDTTFIIY